MLLFLLYWRILGRLQLAKLRLLAKLKKQSFKVLALTGSAGKTSAIQAIEAALIPNFKVKTNQNYNSQFGLPASLLGLKLNSYHPIEWLKLSLLAPIRLLIYNQVPDIYLIEMDVDGPTEPNNISYLLKIVKPDLAIHLNVGTVHTQNFDPLIPSNLTGQKRIDYAKKLMCQQHSVLAKSLSSKQTAFLNLTDPFIKSYSSKLICQVIPIQPKFIPKSLQKKYIFPSIYEITFGTAYVVAKYFGLSDKIILTNLTKNFSLPPGRASYFKGLYNSKIIDSSYNSSPQPTLEFLSLLHQQSTNNLRIAVLGDMRELGQQSEEEHKQLAKIALKYADLIITVGTETQKYFPAHPKIHKFNKNLQALDFLLKNTNYLAQSVILVKGSQNTIFLEEVTKGLFHNKPDSKLLCRQSSHWQKIKQSQSALLSV